MTVGIVGTGPAARAVEAALEDVAASVSHIEAEALGDGELAVVVGGAGDDVFERASEQSLATGTPWIAVELGGIGGYPLVDGAVAGFPPGGPCYACLTGRVAANRDPEEAPTAAPPAHTARFAGAIGGRAAARHLAGGTEGDSEPSVFGSVVEVDGPRRTLLPLPGCDCGGSVERRLGRDHVDRSLDESLGRAEQGLDDRVGIVQEVGEAESFPVPYYLARGCDTSGFSDATAGRDAAGVAAGWDEAFMKALGESIERYCAGVYRTADFESGAPETLESTVAPSAFVCASEPDPDEAIHWVPGENLHTGGEVLLPAELVCYPPPERRSRPAITTGLGLGNGGAGALLAGLYEVVERDATMLAWYSTFDPLAVDVADEAYTELVRRARSEDLEVTSLLVTQDVDVPVIAACVHREEWPRFAVGTSAHLDPARAATGALAEALQNWMELRGMGPDRAAEASGRIGEYADLPEAAADFLDAPSSVPAASLRPTDLPTGEAALERVLAHLEEVDLRAYAARVTTRDVAAIGFEAVRALVPAAQPLFFEDAYFGERARSVPADLGFEHDPDRPHHPFP